MPSLHERLVETTLTEIFGEHPPEFLSRMRQRMSTVQIPGGSVLLRQGDPSDSVYLVLSGRLRATARDRDGNMVVVGDISRGEPLGEMGAITGSPRSATVTAVRDCVLLRLSAEDMTEVLQTWPEATLPLARKLIQRLSDANQQRVGQRKLINICILPLHRSLDMGRLGTRLRDFLHKVSPDSVKTIGLIDRLAIENSLGPGAAEIDFANAESYHRVLSWLDDLESRHHLQIFVADVGDSPWTKLCMRQADHILLAADADETHMLSPVEQKYLASAAPKFSAAQSLWLIHPDERVTPQGTIRWLAARPHIKMDGMSHFHTRFDHEGDWARLARILTGQAVGLVFAGGGAKGFAHLGVMQALEEQGVEWDLAGGTSIGAVMAFYAAIDRPVKRCIELASHAFATNPTGDVSLFPFMSIMRGRRLRRVIREAVAKAAGAQVGIEDLWKPYFCVVSNYSRAEMQVMRLGDAAQAITGSVSIPAALPPVLMQGDLLTDGGTFNNYPVDIMRASGAARIIGVDLSQDKYRPLNFERMPSNLSLFIDRYLRGRNGRRFKGLPNLPTIVFNVASMASISHQKNMRSQVDIAFSPEVSGVGMLDWSAFDRVVEIGLNHARKSLEEQAEPQR